MRNRQTPQASYEKAVKMLTQASQLIPYGFTAPVKYDNNEYMLREQDAKYKKQQEPTLKTYNNNNYANNNYNTKNQSNNNSYNSNRNQQATSNSNLGRSNYTNYGNRNSGNSRQQSRPPEYSSYSNPVSIQPVRRIRELDSQPQANSYRPRNELPNPPILSESKGPGLKISHLSSQQNTKWGNDPRVPDAQLYKILKSRFKLSEFRHNQKSIIKATMLQQDVFVCMPTGGGKSLTFQVPAAMEPGVTLCIMPLVSLIYDQQLQCKMRGLRGYSLTGTSKAADVHTVMSLLESSYLDSEVIIFSTPQKMCQSQRAISALETAYNNGLLKRIVIDEAHCVSTWGRDFRKDYEQLGFLKKKFPKVPLLALTATATQVVVGDIINRLNIPKCLFFKSSFNRQNLYYEVRIKTKDVLKEILNLLKGEYRNASGIIYCSTKKACEELSKQLNNNGVAADFYHAGIEDSTKKIVQDQWMQNRIRVIIATIAFGMGINKPDVRFVIHHSMSKSLENYYQESGRSGRDGAPANCILFYSRGDRNSFDMLNARNEYATDDTKEYNQRKLTDMIRYSQDLFTCRRAIQLSYFGEEFDSASCAETCDNCRLKRSYQQLECGEEVRSLLEFLQEVNSKRGCLTLNQLADIAKSGGAKKGKKNKVLQGLERKGIQYGRIACFRDWDKKSIQFLLIDLLCKDFLVEKVVMMRDRPCSYLYPYMCRQFLSQSNPTYILKIQKRTKRMKYTNQPIAEQDQTTGFDLGDQQETHPSDNSVSYGLNEYTRKSSKESKQSRSDPSYDQDYLNQLESLLSKDKQQKLAKQDSELLAFLEQLYS